jgi:hypothetical protein
MDSLASAAYWEAEAIAEESRIVKFNKHLRRINKTQSLSIISDNFIRLLRTAASRLAEEAAKIEKNSILDIISYIH